MAHIKETPVNWPAISVGVAIGAAVIAVIGWYVADRLTRKRDALQRQERFHRAISGFHIIAIKWIAAIADKDQKIPKVWSIRLQATDEYAAELQRIRARSIPEIETVMREIHPYLSAECKTRFEKEWQNYQEYEIEGITEKNPATGEEITSHDACKSGLINCLEQMKKIAGTIET
jgi:hypothetical protein